MIFLNKISFFDTKLEERIKILTNELYENNEIIKNKNLISNEVKDGKDLNESEDYLRFNVNNIEKEKSCLNNGNLIRKVKSIKLKKNFLKVNIISILVFTVKKKIFEN